MFNPITCILTYVQVSLDFSLPKKNFFLLRSTQENSWYQTGHANHGEAHMGAWNPQWQNTAIGEKWICSYTFMPFLGRKLSCSDWDSSHNTRPCKCKTAIRLQVQAQLRSYQVTTNKKLPGGPGSLQPAEELRRHHRSCEQQWTINISSFGTKVLKWVQGNTGNRTGNRKLSTGIWFDI